MNGASAGTFGNPIVIRAAFKAGAKVPVPNPNPLIVLIFARVEFRPGGEVARWFCGAPSCPALLARFQPENSTLAPSVWFDDLDFVWSKREQLFCVPSKRNPNKNRRDELGGSEQASAARLPFEVRCPKCQTANTLARVRLIEPETQNTARPQEGAS